MLGEELSDDFETYLQPVKEFRDAYEQLCNKYPKYPEMKSRLYLISEEIATIRDKKDISSNIFDEVNHYQYALVELLGYYRDLVKCEL